MKLLKSYSEYTAVKYLLIYILATVSILKNLHARMVSLEGLKFVRYTYPLESSTHLVRPTN